MIKKLTYQEIDFSKYTACIDNAVQKNLYAQTEILAHLCENWELLIFGDYDYVMPVPYKKKWGLKFVMMPLFCQQLGVFGPKQNPEVEEQFLQFFQKNYRIMSYAFNYRNSFGTDFKLKKNFFIAPTEYQMLRKKYFKGRKSTVKTAQYLEFKSIELKDNISFIKNNFKGLEKKTDAEKFFSYLDYLDRRNMLKIFGSFKESQLTNLAIMIDQDNTFSLLGLINDEHFRNDNGASFLIDRILKDHIHHHSFDFMGGSIRGIEVFFKSFGAEMHQYPTIENSKKKMLQNLLKK